MTSPTRNSAASRNQQGPAPRPQGPARLLYVVNDASFFLSHRRPVAEAARAAGYEVHVAAPAGDALAAVKQLGFHVHALSLNRRSLNPLREIVVVASLVRLYRAIRPTLVHHVTIKPIVYGGWAARIARVPRVVNAVTGLGWIFVGTGAKARAARKVAIAGYRVAFRHRRQVTIFQNESDRDRFVAEKLLPASSSTLIRGSGVDVNRFSPTPLPDSGLPAVILPGRMLWDKGVGTFVEAAQLLAAEGVAARFVLVGALDPGNRASIPEATLQEWTSRNLVEWWGFQSDMANVHRQAHIVCLPSRGEGVPLALLEAAASGRPIVTTTAPGCRDAVSPGVSGLLVEPDNPGALAAALRQLIEQPALAQSMGDAGPSHVKGRFDVDTVVRETLAVYEAVLAL